MMIAFYQRGSYPGHLPRSHGVQGCEALAKTMTGTVALALCVGYLAWVFVALAAATAHRYTCKMIRITIDDKEYYGS
jgi:hypothetical protein